jgi:hypothetical protein
MSNLSELLPAGAGAKSAEFVASGTLGSGVTVALKSDGTVEAVAETSIPQAVGAAGTFDASFSLPSANSVTYDSTNNKIIVTYRDSGNSSYGTAAVGTISGGAISFGSPVVYNSGATNQNGATFDSVAGKVVVIYSDDASNYAGSAKIGTVSGTSISFGSVVTFTSSATFEPAPVFDTASGKVVVFFADADAGDLGKAIVGTVSGTSISFGSAVTFYSSALSYVTSTTPPGTSTNSADFIGITDQAIADTATGAVIVQGGVSEKVSSLTTGSDYYVQADGTLSTTVSSVPAGRALSTTSILLEG